MKVFRYLHKINTPVYMALLITVGMLPELSQAQFDVDLMGRGEY